jgi:hypothetical protein
VGPIDPDDDIPAGSINHHCNSGATNSLHPVPDPSGIIPNLPANITAEIHEEYCILQYGLLGTPNTGNENRCIYNPDGTRDSLISGTFEQVACARLDLAGGWVDGIGNNTACPIEVYTLHVTLEDAITHAKRTVESKFEINCSGDLNPTDCLDPASSIDCSGEPQQ